MLGIFDPAELLFSSYSTTQDLFWEIYKERVKHVLTHHIFELISNPAHTAMSLSDSQLTIKQNGWCSSSRSLYSSILPDCSCVLLCDMLMPFFTEDRLASTQDTAPLCVFGKRQICLLSRVTHQKPLPSQYVWEAHVFEAYFHIRKKIDADLETQLEIDKHLVDVDTKVQPIGNVCSSRSTNYCKCSGPQCFAICKIFFYFGFTPENIRTLNNSDIFPCKFM